MQYNDLAVDQWIYLNSWLSCLSETLLQLVHQLKSLVSYKLVPLLWFQTFSRSLHSGRTLVFGRRTFAVLHLTCSWRVTTYVGKPSAIGQADLAFHPFGSIRKKESATRCLPLALRLYCLICQMAAPCTRLSWSANKICCALRCFLLIIV